MQIPEDSKAEELDSDPEDLSFMDDPVFHMPHNNIHLHTPFRNGILHSLILINLKCHMFFMLAIIPTAIAWSLCLTRSSTAAIACARGMSKLHAIAAVCKARTHLGTVPKSARRCIGTRKKIHIVTSANFSLVTSTTDATPLNKKPTMPLGICS